MAVASIDRLVGRLDRVEADAPTVVSAYVRLDVQFRQRKHYLAVLKERARRLQAQLPDRGLDRQGIAEVKRDLARIVDWFGKPSNLPGLPGSAVFACERLGLFEVVPLPRVHRVRLGLDRRPLLQELFDARERLQRHLAVVVDRQHARFFEIAADETIEVLDVMTPTRRGGRFRSDRRDAPGWGERHYLNRMASDKHRHYAEVAQVALTLLEERRLQGLAVMGPSTHARAMLDFIPDHLRDRVLGTDTLNPTVAVASDVGRATWLLQAAHERRDEARLLGALEEGLGLGLAVNGLRETLAALGRGQVRTLLVPDARTATGFRCSASGRLVLAPEQCRGEGDPLPVANLVDAAIDEALKQRAEVRVIDAPEHATRVDGLAATLRFRNR